MSKFEIRFADAEFRAEEDGTMTVSGYANKTGLLSHVLGGTTKFREKIAKGAFARALMNRKHDVDFLAEHDSRLILSSTRNGSLFLEEDAIGLRFEATITPTSWGKDYHALIKSGILKNMSFGFRSIKDNWEKKGPNLYERTVEELEIIEVSVVKDPAYSSSTIQARGIDVVEDVEIPAELRKEDEEMEKVIEILTLLSDEVRSLKDEIKELRSTPPIVEETRDEEGKVEDVEVAEVVEEVEATETVEDVVEPVEEVETVEEKPEDSEDSEDKKEEDENRSKILAELAELRKLYPSRKEVI